MRFYQFIHLALLATALAAPLGVSRRIDSDSTSLNTANTTTADTHLSSSPVSHDGTTDQLELEGHDVNSVLVLEGLDKRGIDGRVTKLLQERGLEDEDEDEDENGTDYDNSVQPSSVALEARTKTTKAAQKKGSTGTIKSGTSIATSSSAKKHSVLALIKKYRGIGVFTMMEGTNKQSTTVPDARMSVLPATQAGVI
jgi:hypothetical protein